MRKRIFTIVYTIIMFILSSIISMWTLNRSVLITELDGYLLLLIFIGFWIFFLGIGPFTYHRKFELSTSNMGIWIGVGNGFLSTIVATTSVLLNLAFMVDKGEYSLDPESLDLYHIVGSSLLLLVFHVVFWIGATALLKFLFSKARKRASWFISKERKYPRSAKALLLTSTLLYLAVALIFLVIFSGGWIAYPPLGFMDSSLSDFLFWLPILVFASAIFAVYFFVLVLIGGGRKPKEAAEERVVKTTFSNLGQWLSHKGEQIREIVNSLNSKISKKPVAKFLVFSVGGWLLTTVLSSVLDWIVQNTLLEQMFGR